VPLLMSSAEAPTNVLIIGSGPAGLLAAHHLLLKGEAGKFKVTVAERRSDPRSSAQASKRSYSLGLGVRGRTAIKKASSALWEIVKSRGVECEKFSLHIGKRVLQIRQTSPLLISEPSVLINRADLCAALLDGFSCNEALRMPVLKFGSQCVDVDTSARHVVLLKDDGSRETVSYDVLIGADGVNSQVRAAMLTAAAGSVKYAEAPLNGTLKTIHQKMPSYLDPVSVHAMGAAIPVQDPQQDGGVEGVEGQKAAKSSERIGLFWVPERNRTSGEQEACALINWDADTAPTSLLAATTPLQVHTILNSAFPQLLGGITLDSAEQFLTQTPSVNFVNKLSTYHHSPSRICVLGDAAHCTGGASGQGCNSALEDAATIAQLLDETPLNLDEALAEFSKRRVEQGHALLDLAVTANSPKSPFLRVGFLVLNGLEGLGHKFLPSLVSPPTQNLLTQTDLPFTEIYSRKAWILDVIKKSNSKLGVFTGY